MKKNIALIFGGESCEHDISIITAKQVASAVDREKYNIIPVYISKTGKWLTSSEENYFKYVTKNIAFKEVYFLPDSNQLFVQHLKYFVKQIEIDVALLALHGKNGEDGSVAAVFQLNKIPHTSCGVLGSSVACDKITYKTLLKGLNIPHVDGVAVSLSEYFSGREEKVIAKIKQLKFPVIIKPSNLGSSIGVYVCKNLEDFQSNIKTAFMFDNRVLVEKFIENCREINVAIYKKDGELIVSDLEEPIKSKVILDFDKKYLTQDEKPESAGLSAMSREIPAKVDRSVKNKVIGYSKKIYTELNLSGVVRFDYLLENDSALYSCEVNTIPGAFANYLFKGKKISFTRLVNDLIDNAIRVKVENDKLITVFESTVLESVGNLGVKK